MIHGASGGRAEDRETFVRRYGPLVKAYLKARWRSSPQAEDLDDAYQEFFIECFRQGGALDRVQPGRGGGFRAFFYGVLRNVALRAESKRGRQREQQITTGVGLEDLEHREARIHALFERGWARSVMREAAGRQEEEARRLGDEALRRVELLRLRFHDDLPIRVIAERWGADPVRVHRDYAKARREFRQALREVMDFYHPNAPEEAEKECSRLLGMLVEES